MLSGGTRKIPNRQSQKGSVSSKTMNAVLWLREYSKKFGDRMPDTGKVHLPMCLTKRSLYFSMKEELTDSDLEYPSLKTFYRIWRENFPNLKLPKVNNVILCNGYRLLDKRLFS